MSVACVDPAQASRSHNIFILQMSRFIYHRILLLMYQCYNNQHPICDNWSLSGRLASRPLFLTLYCICCFWLRVARLAIYVGIRLVYWPYLCEPFCRCHCLRWIDRLHRAKMCSSESISTASRGHTSKGSEGATWCGICPDSRYDEYVVAVLFWQPLCTIDASDHMTEWEYISPDSSFCLHSLAPRDATGKHLICHLGH